MNSIAGLRNVFSLTLFLTLIRRRAGAACCWPAHSVAVLAVNRALPKLGAAAFPVFFLL